MAKHLSKPKGSKENKLPPPKVVKRPKFGERDVHFTVKELPQIKDWEVEGKYQIVLNVTQKSDEIREFGPDKGVRSARFEINKVTAYTEPIK